MLAATFRTARDRWSGRALNRLLDINHIHLRSFADIFVHTRGDDVESRPDERLWTVVGCRRNEGVAVDRIAAVYRELARYEALAAAAPRLPETRRKQVGPGGGQPRRRMRSCWA
jgi:hypothetical protein